ncbi:MAG: antitermination protein NusA, partial [Raoultibacter sp.]
QNARLAARLTGWHIDIKSTSFAGEPPATDNMLIDEDTAVDDEAGLCAFVSEDGVRCRNHARPGGKFCGIHSDDEA